MIKPRSVVVFFPYKFVTVGDDVNHSEIIHFLLKDMEVDEAIGVNSSKVLVFRFSWLSILSVIGSKNNL